MQTHKLLIVCLFMSLGWKTGDLKLKGEIRGFFTGICSDRNSSIYGIKQDQIIRYDLNGKQQFEFAEKRLGPLSSIDSKGGMRILAFYQSSGQVQFLDNTLTPIGGPVRLSSLGIEDPRLCCLASREGYWVYDAGKDNVKRLGWDGKILNESPILADWRGASEPTQLLEKENQLWLALPDSAVLILDIYGNPKKKIGFGTPGKRYDVYGDIVYQLTAMGDSLTWNNIKTFEVGGLKLPIDSCFSFSIEESRIFLLSIDKISIFSQK